MPLLPFRDLHCEAPALKDASLSSAPPSRPHSLARNRRKRYLELHPEYFGGQLEHADPLLYDRLVRHWYTLAEREEERKERGFSGSFEADLERSEARLEAAQRGDLRVSGTDNEGKPRLEVKDEEQMEREADTREAAWKRWKHEMVLRFIMGKDDQFDYKIVDLIEDYDDIEEESRNQEEQYFGDEQPHWGVDGQSRIGETGVQDF